MVISSFKAECIRGLQQINLDDIFIGDSGPYSILLFAFLYDQKSLKNCFQFRCISDPYSSVLPNTLGKKSHQMPITMTEMIQKLED